MYDKLDLEIPFDDLFVREFNGTSQFDRAGSVDPKFYDFKGIQLITWVDGKPIVESSSAKKWESVSSNISSIAVGFYPEGNGFNQWPHIRLKASPAKILQGHNIFGSEDPRQGAMQMLATLRQAYPKIYQHLAIDRAKVCYVDCTYSARLESRFWVNHIFKFLENLANIRTKINRNTDYLQLGQGSEYNRQKFYMKDQEVEADYQAAKRRREKSRIEILSDTRLRDWAQNLLRLEATVGKRKFEALGIPTDLKGFLKFNDWFKKIHGEPLARHLWRQCFSSVFEQVEGHTMKDVDDSAVKLKIDSKFITYKTNSKTGKVTVNKRKANAVFRTFRDIKTEGYSALVSENNTTFKRNVNCLIDCGFSRAFLKSLDPQRPNDNVIPMVRLLNVDFGQQRPDWYVEPVANFDDRRRHLKAVG